MSETLTNRYEEEYYMNRTRKQEFLQGRGGFLEKKWFKKYFVDNQGWWKVFVFGDTAEKGYMNENYDFIIEGERGKLFI